MGYSYVFLGDLRFPDADSKAAWYGAALDGTGLDGPSDWSFEKGDDTPATALAAFEGETASLEQTSTTVKLRAVVDKGGDAFGERRQLLCAVRRAADFGGEGELTVVGYTDFPGSFGLRAVVAGGASTCDELDEDEAAKVEASAAYREADALVAAVVEAAMPKGALEANLKALSDEEAARGAAVRAAADMGEVLRGLRAVLPKYATYREQSSLPRGSVVRALADRKDADADERMLAAFRKLTSKAAPDDGEKLVAFALGHALALRGTALDEIVTVWIESPRFFFRDHERVRALGRPDLDARLAALLGVARCADRSENHKWIVEALFASDPEHAATRAAALLEGDPRQRPGSLESLRWIVTSFYEHPERRSPAWEALLLRLVEGPAWSDQAYDLLDQIRVNAIGLLAAWKLPQALSHVRDQLARLGVSRAVELLVALGDPAGVPVLEAELARAKRKPDRTALEKGIAALTGGAPPAATGFEHVIEVASSGRAGCRGCKEKIAKGVLRFGEAAANPFSDGGEPSMRWYHLECAAKKRPKLFGPTLAAYGGEVPDREALVAAVEAALQPKTKKAPKKA